MEDKALEIIHTMLSQRKKGAIKPAERITVEDLENVNTYMIDGTLLVFSQKDKMIERDIEKMMSQIADGQKTAGIIFISRSPPSENTLKSIKLLSNPKTETDDVPNMKIQFFHIRQLQFDITTHRMVMPHRILNEDEKTQVFETYKISSPDTQLPWIDSQDAMAKWVGAVPGDVIEVTRHSDTVGKTMYYRYCAEDVNVA
jgi:DNA-directed RNA polymerase subunit H (RpoH/RPB5)